MEYDDMLDRAVRESPDATGEGARFEVPAPSVRREGNATVVENFSAIADRLARAPDDLLRHVQGELGTAARVDDGGRARLTGAFDGERVADAVDSYVRTYVTCPECGLPDTHLVDDGRTLACTACGARSAVDRS